MSSLHAGFEKLACNFESMDYDTFTYDNFKLEVRPQRDGSCSISINTEESGDSRSYSFSEDGKMHITYSFPTQVPSSQRGTLSKSTGTKAYFFYPKVRELNVYRDPSTGEIKVEMINGGDMYIDPSSGLINESKTKDFIVKQTVPLVAKRSNISITPTKFPILTFPYVTGWTSELNRDRTILLENEGRRCRILANKIFDYEVSCGAVPSCQCDPNEDPITAQLKTCAVDVSKTRHLRGGDLNGAEFKDSSPRGLSSIVNKKCPGFFTDAQIEQEVQRGTKLSTSRGIKRTSSKTAGNSEVTRSAKGKFPSEGSNPTTRPRRQEKKEGSVAELDLPSNCLEKLKEFFDKDENKELINDYIQIQGKITLHRIAWTALKLSEQNTKNIENTIEDLLKDRSPELHQQFVNNGQLSRNQKLFKIMGELKESSQALNSEENVPYTLKFSDVKMVQLLVEAEGSFGRTYDEGVMDYISIIKNSMLGRLDNKQKILNMEKN